MKNVFFSSNLSLSIRASSVDVTYQFTSFKCKIMYLTSLY